jgi:hypothetical protein
VGVIAPDPENIRYGDEPVSNDEREPFDSRSGRFGLGLGLGYRCRRGGKCVPEASRKSP